MSDFETELRDAMTAHHVLVSDDVVERLVKHYALLVKWNRTYNLTRIIKPRAAARAHYVDCLLALRAADVETWPSLTDVGSGAGFPGLVAAMLNPERPVILVEKVAKKASFLREAVRILGLKHVQVSHRALTEDDEVDYVCTRATLPYEHPLFHHLACAHHAFFMVAEEPDREYWVALCERYGRVGERQDYQLQGAEHRAVLTLHAPEEG